MLWLLLALAVIVGVARDEFSNLAYGFMGYISFGLLLCLLSLLIFGAAMGIASLIGLALPNKERLASQSQLVALRPKDGIVGNFFLGSGQIESRDYYFFYRKIGDNKYQSGKVPMDSAIVYEEERSDADLQTYISEQKASYYTIFAIVWPTSRYEFHIPIGSILTGFRL